MSMALCRSLIPKAGIAPQQSRAVAADAGRFRSAPNVGAVVAIDYGNEAVNNDDLRAYLQEHYYPLADVPHRFYSLSRSFEANVEWFMDLLAEGCRW